MIDTFSAFSDLRDYFVQILKMVNTVLLQILVGFNNFFGNES